MLQHKEPRIPPTGHVQGAVQKTATPEAGAFHRSAWVNLGEALCNVFHERGLVVY